MDYRELAGRIIAGEWISRQDGEAILDSPDSDLLSLLDAAFLIRRRYFGLSVQIHRLMNSKSGLCPEDCSYCSQSAVSGAEIEKYSLLDEEHLIEGARLAVATGARRYCMAISGRGPSDAEIDHMTSAVRRIKSKFGISVCLSLGLMDESKARRLKEAGVDRLNHNLNTSERYYPEICTTHTYAERMDTLSAARETGMELCSGVIFGQGEHQNDIMDVCEALRDLSPESIPVNFLNAIAETPLEGIPPLGPVQCLRLLCLMRFYNPRSEIRVAGGREVQLREHQALALYPANSLFVSGYLTTPGQSAEDAHRMIRELGFEVDTVGYTDPEIEFPEKPTTD
jgi:biotin synthase